MDYIHNVFLNFLELENFVCMNFQWMEIIENIKNIFISIPRMKESVMGLNGLKQIMTVFIFGRTIHFNYSTQRTINNLSPDSNIVQS